MRPEEFLENIRFHEIDLSSLATFEHPPSDLALAAKMAEVARESGLELFHVHYAMPHAVTGFLAQQMLGAKAPRLVTTLHGTDITLVGHDRSFLEITRFGIERSDAVTAVSEYLARVTREVFTPVREIEVVPNFVDPDRWRPDDGSRAASCFARGGERLLLHVSNFRPVKRVLDVVEVFDRVRREVPSRLLMIGDGPDRPAAEALCRSRGISGLVHFLGNTPAVQEVMPAADLYVLTTDMESFGLSALEAQACGVPVLGYRAGGLSEVVEDGRTGFLRGVGDVEGLAADGVGLLKDEAAWGAASRAARERAVSRFDADAIVGRYLAIYERVLAEAEAPVAGG
jgi:N-acetyl-alpha-D-glucosaminyl L-malate synthase BshA